MPNPIVTIQNLYVGLKNDKDKQILKNVNITVEAESITAFVGGSGSGKTTTAMSILKLLSPALEVVSGQILYKGYNLSSFSDSKMREIRGKEIGVVFQEPLSAFNPLFTLGAQVDEVLRFHTNLDPHRRQQRILELFDLVGLPHPERVYASYPHQLSGGMRQRVMIAQAIAADPQLIIADEPTSSLDVTLQAKIIQLFKELRQKLKLSIIIISHDLGLVEHLSDSVVVMKQGRVVESGKTKDVIQNPQDEYTKQLLNAVKV